LSLSFSSSSISRCPCLFLLSFHLPGAHRYLHSCPTRRSSDLRVSPVIGSVTSRWSSDASTSSRYFSSNCCASSSNDANIARCTRSEEHTSELQSRENLVCRLLLEKKKK